MRLLIADRQATTRSALKILFREEPDLDVIGEAADSQALLALARSHRPDVVLLDWELPGQPAADLLAALSKLNTRPSVVILSGRPELESSARAAGADAFVSMVDPPKRLLAALYAIKSQRDCEKRSE
jgi:two-component system response regulator DesR